MTDPPDVVANKEHTTSPSSYARDLRGLCVDGRRSGLVRASVALEPPGIFYDVPELSIQRSVPFSFLLFCLWRAQQLLDLVLPTCGM